MTMNYKDTLLLPRTEFPMKANLAAREPEMLAEWERAGLYRQIQASRKEAPLYVLHDGPPFANGDVHMGTALNKLLKDFIVKSRTMLGFRAPFVPGWDCHGLPIEFRVVKESKGLNPAEVRTRSEAYARQYIDIQKGQFRRLGVFGDWDHPYLTLLPSYEATVLRTFGSLVAKNLVYRSEKPVYWSTGAQTALAEAEIEYQNKESPAVFVAFSSTGGQLNTATSIVIWTTTPWTLPANLGVAVHPELEYSEAHFEREGETRLLVIAKERVAAFEAVTGWKQAGEVVCIWKGRELEGQSLRHPFLDRRVPMILADFVTLETGTGCVHIAPGHGTDDYNVGRKYNLGLLSPVDEKGRFTEECGVPEWVGQYVFDANKAVVARLLTDGKLIGHEVWSHSYPHCWRSKTPIIFRAVDQFFIRIEAIRKQAMEEIEKVKWIPDWGLTRIGGTVSTRPDWCISRQRSWGVPLPVFYTAEGEPVLDPVIIERVAMLVEEKGSNIWFTMPEADLCEAVGLSAEHTRKFDTLDVWIDSGVSHQAVLRTHPELHFPADLYLEATDQHRGWFQSSLLTSVAVENCAPYKTVITHGFVTDTDGSKISKSSAYKKPTDAAHFVNQHGADIVRLWVASVSYTDEVPFGDGIFKSVSDVYRRMRNTIRILLANLGDFDPANNIVDRAQWTLVDRWLMHRLQIVIKTCREAYEAYDFHRVFNTLNEFCTVHLSSLYVDITKDRMYCDPASSPRRRASQTVMHAVFDSLVRLMAPICVFTAEEAWKHAGHTDSVHTAHFPESDLLYIDDESATLVESLLALRAVIAQAIEPARQAKEIGSALDCRLELEIADPALRGLVEAHHEIAEEFFILSELVVQPGEVTQAKVRPASNKKCARCWRHRPGVGASAEHPELCERCQEALVQAL